MSNENKRKIGTEKEMIAGRYLMSKGYEILCYHYRCRQAEIDIVAMEKSELVFCEVKYRKHAGLEGALQAVDSKKQKRISIAALYYISQNRCENVSFRFDVIAMTDTKIQHIKNAFYFQ